MLIHIKKSFKNHAYSTSYMSYSIHKNYDYNIDFVLDEYFKRNKITYNIIIKWILSNNRVKNLLILCCFVCVIVY